MTKKLSKELCNAENCNRLTGRRHNDIPYCEKHIFQLKRHGKIFIRTRFDPNEFILYDDYAEIILYDREGNERDRTVIDLEDVEKCKQHKWHKKESIRGKEYVFTRIEGVPIRLHRFLLDYFDTELEIDHMDGNGLNNRKNNLRKVCHQENMRNQTKLPSNNTSGHIGVRWHTQNHNWVAGIKINGKNIHLGSFQNKEDAIKCREENEKKYFNKKTLKQNIQKL